MNMYVHSEDAMTTAIKTRQRLAGYGKVCGYATWDGLGQVTHYFIDYDESVWVCKNLPKPCHHFSYPDSKWERTPYTPTFLSIHTEMIGSYDRPKTD